MARSAVTLVGKAKEEVPKVMLRGGDDSPAVVEGLRKLDKIEIVPETPNWKDQIINKEIRAAVEIPAGFQADVAGQKSDTVKIYNYEGELKSEFATDKGRKIHEGIPRSGGQRSPRCQEPSAKPS